MDVLCSDKTGTLTEGKVRLHAAVDADGTAERARCGSTPTSTPPSSRGFSNPIDAGHRRRAPALDARGYRKLDEEPYDFVRKRLSVLVERRRPSTCW